MDGSPQLVIRDEKVARSSGAYRRTRSERQFVMWTVEVVFDANRYLEDKDLEAKLIAKAGRETNFSGSGLGERDLGWYFSTEAEARACADKFRDDPILRVRIYEEEHE